jgi:hypothetical protein
VLAGIVAHKHPSGIYVDKLLLPNLPYSDPTDAIVHAWRPSHWYTWAFQVGAAQNVTGAAALQAGGTAGDEWQLLGGLELGIWRTAAVRSSTPTVRFLSTNASTLQSCEALATNASSMQKPLVAFTYFHGSFVDPDFAGSCYGLELAALHNNTFRWAPRKMAGVDSGKSTTAVDTWQLNFSAGGDQGGEGEGGGAEWYVEGVKEELDDALEFWWDQASRILYFIPNATIHTSRATVPPPSEEFVATNLAVLFESTSEAAPEAVPGWHQPRLQNLSFVGLEIRDTAYVGLDAQTLPSGGDWGTSQSGALLLRGTENLLVDRCLFQRLDGNAIFLQGYHRKATVSNNEFCEIGDSAILAFGQTSRALNANESLKLPWPIGPDARSGNQPWDTRIIGNVGREIGLFQKQSSLFFAAISARTVIRCSIFAAESSAQDLPASRI